MVNLILENLLSTATNRVLYQTLWSLSLTKNCKPENVKNCENFSIESICNELIQQIARDEPNPSKFYFSAQLAFGVIQLYRFQIDKLLTQVRHALQSCKATFFEIDWLSRLQEPNTEVIESDALFALPIKKVKKDGKQQKSQPLTFDFDLIENALTIPEDTEPIAKKKNNRKSIDQADPTLVNLKNITIAERFVPRYFDRVGSVINENFDDFGEDAQQDFGVLFSPPAQIKEITRNDHEILELRKQPEIPDIQDEPEVPDVLRSEIVRPPSPNYGLLEPTLSDDIMDIVNQQKSKLKRVSDTFDISQRLERAAKIPRLDEEVNNSLNVNNSSFDHNANVVEAVDKENQPPIIENDLPDILKVLPTSPMKNLEKSGGKARKPRQKKRKLIIDKIKKISADEIKDDMDNYKERFTEVGACTVFTENLNRRKFSVEALFTAPAACMKACAGELLKKLFDRNLKIVKLKKKREVSVEGEEEGSSPIKKRKLRERPEVMVPEVEGIQNPEVEGVQIPGVEGIQVPEVEGVQVPPTEEALDLPPIEPVQVTEFAPVMDEPVQVKENTGSAKKYAEIETYGYRDSEKWSKEKIMKALEDFWNQDDNEVTMNKLCGKSNRIIKAGVFFQLMVLSKEQAVELIQGDGNQIVNIAPGPNIEIYI